MKRVHVIGPFNSGTNLLFNIISKCQRIYNKKYLYLFIIFCPILNLQGCKRNKK